MLSVSSLKIPNPHPSPRMMMRNGRLISYKMVCQILDHHLDSVKLPYNVKFEVQTNIVDVDKANTSMGLNSLNIIDMQLNEVKLFDTISPNQMAEYQKRDTQLSLVYQCVC